MENHFPCTPDLFVFLLPFADEFGIPFYEVDAEKDINVDEAFLTLARDVKNRLMAEGRQVMQPMQESSSVMDSFTSMLK